MDYSKLKIGELKIVAKEKGLRNISGLKKSELVELLTNVDQMINRPVVKDTPAKPEEPKTEESKAEAPKDEVKEKKTGRRKKKEEDINKASDEAEGKTADNTSGEAADNAAARVSGDTDDKMTDKASDDAEGKTADKASDGAEGKTVDKASDDAEEKTTGENAETKRRTAGSNQRGSVRGRINNNTSGDEGNTRKGASDNNMMRPVRRQVGKLQNRNVSNTDNRNTGDRYSAGSSNDRRGYSTAKSDNFQRETVRTEAASNNNNSYNNNNANTAYGANAGYNTGACTNNNANNNAGMSSGNNNNTSNNNYIVNNSNNNNNNNNYNNNNYYNNNSAPAQAADNQTETEQAEKIMMQYDGQEYNAALNSGENTHGILEVLPEGYGFIRSDNYMPGERDIYISPAQIRRFRLKTGDIIRGPIRKKMGTNEKFRALLYIESVNGMFPSQLQTRLNFEDMTPVFPNKRINLDYNNAPVSLRIVDLFSPIGKGQRGMIVSPPKAGKTTLLKQIAKRISVAYPEMNLLVLLIDERPEEVTDIRESIEGPNAEVIYSTFDELPEHHKRVSEMVIERAKRLVESRKDVVILIDSITRLSRAYNLTVPPSGRTLSGGLDPAALHMPKKFFGAARNMREGGSLTILATALIDTGSRMDDVVFEEFKGTGNMELVLDRNLSEKRVFPAIDIAKSGTRKDDLLLTPDEIEVLDAIHSQLRGLKSEEITEEIIKIFAKTKNNREFLEYCGKIFVRR
ncbi:MAG: transcription termination factor Rho [Eubacterium sp.]|nr:transcription termination factor Rho [Eubacterium sp.]